MKWLRKLLHRRIVKGLSHRLKSIEDLMDSAEKNKEILYQKIEALGEPSADNEKSLAVYRDELETWGRIYWDSWSRYEEVDKALRWVLKDY